MTSLFYFSASHIFKFADPIIKKICFLFKVQKGKLEIKEEGNIGSLFSEEAAQKFL